MSGMSWVGKGQKDDQEDKHVQFTIIQQIEC